MTDTFGNIDAGGSLYALALIIDQLKSDDSQIRLDGIGKLPTVALAVGPKRTREELLPFLKEATADEDEILLAIAKQMGDFVTYVGGKEYASRLIPILENIMGVEEIICREEAVKSMNKIISLMSEEDIVSEIIPIIESSSRADFFTKRTSLCGIFPATYTGVSDANHKKNIRKQFKTLCCDDTPIVRRTAAIRFIEFLNVVDPADVEMELFPSFISLLKDEQDSVRVATVDAFPDMIRICNDKLKELLSEELRRMFVDKSWRIRYKIADLVPTLHLLLPKSFVYNDLLIAYKALLRDDEPEVRTNAANKIAAYCENLDSELCVSVIVDSLMPCIKDLVEDPNVNVKTAIASVILKLSFYLDKEKTMEYILPLFHVMLRDSVPDVRLNVLSNLGNFHEIVGSDEVSNSLLPTIIELADDTKWRVRLAVIKFIPVLAAQLGEEFFNAKLTEICLSWLCDDVFTIREEVASVVVGLLRHFGVEWGKKYLVPKFEELCADKSYLRRMTALFAMNMYLQSEADKELVFLLYPMAMGLCQDVVPNVRFNAVKTLTYMARYLTAELTCSEVTPKLRELISDADPDVKFYAHNAIEYISTNALV